MKTVYVIFRSLPGFKEVFGDYIIASKDQAEEIVRDLNIAKTPAGIYSFAEYKLME